MNPNDGRSNPVPRPEPQGRPRRTGMILLDRFMADPESAGMRWLHLWVVGTPDSRYYGLVTVGAGRGEGYGLPEIAQNLTHQLEAEFNLPAERTAWAARLLSPPASSVEAAVVQEGVARIDVFQITDLGFGRLAVAVPTDRLVRQHFGGVSLPALPKPPRSTANIHRLGHRPGL